MDPDPTTPEAAAACASCGTAMPPALLACPSCGRLVHASRLKLLATRAEDAGREGRPADAIAAWREALQLLPPGAVQARQVGERIESLLARPDARAAVRRARTGTGAWRGVAGLGLVGVLIAGATKLPALAGLLGMFGVLWAAFGWKLAAGVLVSLYIHELGHVIAMWRRGLSVTAPMFVPGLGAYVRLNERPATAVEDNRIGLAGPVAGLLAAAAAWMAGMAAQSPLFLAVASVGAMINLFNLIPVWQLDGARGFSSLVRWQRFALALAFGLAFAVTREPLLLLPGLVAVVVSVVSRPAEKPDHAGFAGFVGLIAGLSALAGIDVPGAG